MKVIEQNVSYHNRQGRTPRQRQNCHLGLFKICLYLKQQNMELAQNKVIKSSEMNS